MTSNKRDLYERIMHSVSREVKKTLNEATADKLYERPNTGEREHDDIRSKTKLIARPIEGAADKLYNVYDRLQAMRDKLHRRNDGVHYTYEIFNDDMLESELDNALDELRDAMMPDMRILKRR